MYSRLETLAQYNRLVGFARAALREACYGAQADSLLLVEYELLAQAPERVLWLVYEFLGEDGSSTISTTCRTTPPPSTRR